AVAAPDDDQVRALLQDAAKCLRRLPALRHLAPDRLDAPALERPPELWQPAAERLPRVGDHGHPHARTSRVLPTSRAGSRSACPSRASLAAPHARTARSATSSAPVPTSAPEATSLRWCMPRYIRDAATARGRSTASVQASAATQRRGVQEEMTS